MTTASSSPTFMCGVAKVHRRMRTCPPQHSKRSFERLNTEPSISHHRHSLNINCQLSQRPTLHTASSRSTSGSRVQRVTLRDVVNVKSACVCNNRRVIGIQDLLKREEDLEPTEVSTVCKYYRRNSLFEVVYRT